MFKPTKIQLMLAWKTMVQWLGGKIGGLGLHPLFREFSRIKRRLWGGELWEDGYFARTVGDKITAEVIRRYIQHHRTEKVGDLQLNLFA